MRGRHPDLAPEQAAKESGVFIAHLLGYGPDQKTAGFRHLLGFLKPQGMDIESGLGGIDLLLAMHFGAASITGIDVEADLFAAAQALARARGLSDPISFQTVPPGPLTFADASFDMVFSKDALVPIDDKPGLYREIARVLRPGGSSRAGDWPWAQGAAPHPLVTEWLGAVPRPPVRPHSL